MAIKRKRAPDSTPSAQAAQKLPGSGLAKIGDFTLLPLVLPPTLDLPRSTHYLYLRAHSGTSASQSSSSSSRAQDNALPSGRTLFVVNLPPHCGERELRAVCSRWGVVERIVLRGLARSAEEGGGVDEAGQDDPMDEAEPAAEEAEADDSESDSDAPAAPNGTTGRPARRPRPPAADPTPKPTPLPTPPSLPHPSALSAHVIFLDPASLLPALRPHPPTPLYARPPLGLTHHLALHTSLRPPLAVVRAHADGAIAAWESSQEAARSSAQKGKYKMGEAAVDDDGFTLVKRGGKYGRALGGGVGVASRAFELAHRPAVLLPGTGPGTGPGARTAAAAGDADAESRKGRGRKKKARRAAGEVQDFYRFQVREKKRKEFIGLREAFQRDRLKVEKMREERRFRPY